MMYLGHFIYYGLIIASHTLMFNYDDFGSTMFYFLLIYISAVTLHTFIVHLLSNRIISGDSFVLYFFEMFVPMMNSSVLITYAGHLVCQSNMFGSFVRDFILLTLVLSLSQIIYMFVMEYSSSNNLLKLQLFATMTFLIYIMLCLNSN